MSHLWLSHLPLTTSTSSSSSTLPSATQEHAAQSVQQEQLREHPVHHAHPQAPSVDKLRQQESLWREDLQSGGNPRTTTPTVSAHREFAEVIDSVAPPCHVKNYSSRWRTSSWTRSRRIRHRRWRKLTRAAPTEIGMAAGTDGEEVLEEGYGKASHFAVQAVYKGSQRWVDWWKGSQLERTEAHQQRKV